MAQDTESGRRAERWGKETAGKIATLIGADGFDVNARSNECSLNGKPIVIKCAARTTGKIGVTVGVLDRVHRVIAAIQREDGSFEIRSVRPGCFSRGDEFGQLTIFRRAPIGELMGRVSPGLRAFNPAE